MLSFPDGEQRFRDGFGSGFEPMNQHELFVELHSMIGQIHGETTFRSDHASNWLPLKGQFPADKPRLLEELATAIAAPDQAQLRPEWARGL